MHPITRAFAVGAIVASRDGYASTRALSNLMKPTQQGLSALVLRIQQRAKDSGLNLWDPILYENDLGRGRPELLSQEQKAAIIQIVIASRESREKEAWQAIKSGDFLSIAPQMSVSTFENVMYEAGYSRRKPGWKPHLTPAQERERYAWALRYNPDRYEVGDGLGFDFRIVVFTDETPARIGDERGMIRAWARDDEIYDDDVRHDRNRKDCCLQFFGGFRYGHKGPCHVYFHETQEEIQAGEEALQKENVETRVSANHAQRRARGALQELGELDVNLRNSTRKLQHVKKHDYHRGIRSRGGVDGYRHREGALKKLVPWINSLKKLDIPCVLLEDGAPAHKSRIANDYLTVEKIDKIWWPGHSPDVNASEHAWPWMRSHVTKQFTPSCNEQQCKEQWEAEWEAMPIDIINRWVMHVPVVVRRILHYRGKNCFHG